MTEPTDETAPLTRERVLDRRISLSKTVERVVGQRITMQPNIDGGAHVHLEPLLGVVLRGQAVLEFPGEPARHLQSGDTFYEPAGQRIKNFGSGPEGVEFIAYSLLVEGTEPQIDFVD